MFGKSISLKRASALFVATILLAANFGAAPATRAQTMPTIAFFQYSTSAFAASEIAGATAALNQAGFTDGKTAKFITVDAKGDAAAADAAIKGFVDQKVDVIISAGTSATLAAVKGTTATKGPNIVFAGLTDPFAAGVAKDSCDKPAWVTGTQALDPFETSIGYIAKIKPGAKTVGVLYNPDEAVAVIALKLAQPMLEKAGLTVVTEKVTKSADVAAAAKTVIDKKVDVVYVFGENTVDPAFADLIKATNAAKIPVITTTPEQATAGAVLAVGVDYTADGMNAGNLAALILNKKLDISKAKINNATATLLAVNPDAATAVGVTIPDDVLKAAAITVKGGKATTAAPAAMATMDASAMDAFLKASTCTK
jgi:putative ABC transport system substrate-binding protein